MKDRLRKKLQEALIELHFARHNIKDCPFLHPKEERENIGELEHSDIHVESAESLIKECIEILEKE